MELELAARAGGIESCSDNGVDDFLRLAVGELADGTQDDPGVACDEPIGTDMAGAG